MARVRLLASLVAVTLLLLPAAAQARDSGKGKLLVYNCNITTTEDNLIGRRLVIMIDPATGEVGVLTEMIYRFNRKMPIRATIKKENSARLTIGWTVPRIPVHGETRLSAFFDATVLKSNLRVNVNGWLQSYDNNESGSGTCTIEHW